MCGDGLRIWRVTSPNYLICAVKGNQKSKPCRETILQTEGKHKLTFVSSFQQSITSPLKPKLPF